MTLNAILNTVYTALVDGTLRALQGWTDGVDCDGSGTYPVIYSKPVTFTSHADVFLEKNTGMAGAESILVTSATVSPNDTIVYDDPTWAVPIAMGDDVDLRIDTGSNYFDATGIRPVYNFNGVDQDIAFTAIALTGDYFVSGEFFWDGVQPVANHALLGHRTPGPNTDPTSFVLFQTTSVNQVVWQIPIAAGFVNLANNFNMVEGHNTFRLSVVAGLHTFTMNGVDATLTPTAPAGITMNRIGSRAGLLFFSGYIANININDVASYAVNDNTSNINDSIGVNDGTIQNFLQSNWATAAIGAAIPLPQTVRLRNCLDPINANVTGLLLEDFETIGDWADPATGGTFAANTTTFKTGTQSLEIGTPDSVVRRRYKYFSGGVDWSEGEYFDLWVNFDDVASNPNITIHIGFINDAAGNFAGATSVTVGGAITGTAIKGVNHWRFRKSDFTAGTDWSTVYNIQLSLFASGGQATVCGFDALYLGNRKKPTVIFTLDDGSLNQYETWRDFFDPRGVQVSIMVNGSLIDTTGTTTANLQSMETKGSEVCNHTFDHDELTTLPNQAAMETAINDQTVWMQSKGFANWNIFAYPNGSLNDTAIEACKAQGMILARGLRGGIGNITSYDLAADTLGIANKYAIVSINLNNATTLAAAIASVDRAINDGSTIIFYAHLFDVVADSNTWTYSDITDLLDHVNLRIDQGLLNKDVLSSWFKNQPITPT